MAAALSFRFLQGQRAQGCVRVSGEEMLLSLQGLSPGPCALYRIVNGHASEALVFVPAADGSAVVTAPATEKVFIADEKGVVLWEGGEMNYWQAAAFLEKLRRPPEAPPVPPPPEPEPEPPQASAVPEAAAPGYVLRAPGDGPPVTALPALLWPEEVRPLRPYFEAHVPFAPFDAPGWRFIRVPSPLRSIPFCAVGVRAVGGTIAQVAWAVPGSPVAAPAALPGYRYQSGRNGQGYWTFWKNVEK